MFAHQLYSIEAKKESRKRSQYNFHSWMLFERSATGARREHKHKPDHPSSTTRLPPPVFHHPAITSIDHSAHGTKNQTIISTKPIHRHLLPPVSSGIKGASRSFSLSSLSSPSLSQQAFKQFRQLRPLPYTRHCQSQSRTSQETK